MVYSLTYRRPPHVESRRESLASEQTGQSVGGSTLAESQDTAVNFGIPEALSFDRIIDGGTCPVGRPVILTRSQSDITNSSLALPEIS